MYKQIIIARKDLGMSAGKLAAQVSHASMAFLSDRIKKFSEIGCYAPITDRISIKFEVESDIFSEWICGSFTKVILQAKNKHALDKAITKAKELGFKEGEDFYVIRDDCRTELTPEEVDEKGVGRTVTCVGFKPMASERIDLIGKDFRLWHD